MKIAEFEIFDTWIDHFKYRLKVGRTLWLPKFIKHRINVKYRKIFKKVEVEVPVQVLLACPHATFKWGDKNHIQFLFPSKFEVLK